jgi:hypothetical protein
VFVWFHLPLPHFVALLRFAVAHDLRTTLVPVGCHAANIDERVSVLAAWAQPGQRRAVGRVL